MKKLLLALGIIALAACEKSSDEIITPPDSQSPRLLTVEVSETPMHDENASARNMTRTEAATTTETLSAFSMNYMANKYDFTKSGTWSTNEWPYGVPNDTKIDFYAYNGGTFNYNEGNPYVNFTMDDNDAFNQKDFLVAANNKSFNDNNGVVPLSFDHACAAVQFKVFKQGDADITVNSIVLKNVMKTGDYYYNESTQWQHLSNATDYLLTDGDITVTTDKQLLPCHWLFIIPQSKTSITIEVKYNTNQQKDISLTGSWVAGKRYTISIRI